MVVVEELRWMMHDLFQWSGCEVHTARSSQATPSSTVELGRVPPCGLGTLCEVGATIARGW